MYCIPFNNNVISRKALKCMSSVLSEFSQIAYTMESPWVVSEASCKQPKRDIKGDRLLYEVFHCIGPKRTTYLQKRREQL